MDIHGKSVNMDMDMDGRFHIHGKPDNDNVIASSHQDIEQRHLIVPIIEELELPK